MAGRDNGELNYEGIQRSLFEGLDDSEIAELCPYLVKGESAPIRKERLSRTGVARRTVTRAYGPNYSGFLREHRTRNISEELDKSCASKKRMLMEFSSRFRLRGTHDLEGRDYTPTQIGKMYQGILKQALKEESRRSANVRYRELT